MNSEFQMGHKENYWDLKESKGLGYILLNLRFIRPYWNKRIVALNFGGKYWI